jgi:hypothetical protein
MENNSENKIEEKEQPKKFFTKSRIYLLISICFVIAMPIYYEIMINIYLK